jgi:hypothetical protein
MCTGIEVVYLNFCSKIWERENGHKKLSTLKKQAKYSDTYVSP